MTTVADMHHGPPSGESDGDGQWYAAEDLMTRTEPNAVDAEQVVLGTMLTYKAAIPEARHELDGALFYRPSHETIFNVICELADRGEPTGPVEVRSELERQGLARAVGNGPYLGDIFAKATTPSQLGYYVRLITEAAARRTVLSVGVRLQQAAFTSQAEDLSDAVRNINVELRAVANGTLLESWPDPTPISTARKVPAFPIDALPKGWLRDFVIAVAESVQTPVDVPGCLLFSVLSTAAAGRVWIQAPTWSEPACLYVLIVQPPAARKSETFRVTTAPIRLVESELKAAAAKLLVEARVIRQVAEDRAAQAAKAAATASKGDQDRKLAEATAAAQELAATELPVIPKLYTADTTVEALATLMTNHDGRMAVLAPEGKIFSNLAGQYSGTPEFSLLLSGHAGEEWRTDRSGRSEHMAAVIITLGVCIQPGVLARMGAIPQFREQGLLARMLYSVPPSIVGFRKTDTEPVPEELTNVYTANIAALIRSLRNLDEPITITFAPEATAFIRTWQKETEARLRPDADLGHIDDWAGKLVGATVRIAGLLHLAEQLKDGFAKPISLDTVTAAAELAEYFTGHALAAYDAMGADPAVQGARDILNWIERNQVERFTARDVQPSLRGRFPKVSDLDPALRVLETHGYVRRAVPQARSGTGRAPSAAWLVHPRLSA